MNCRSTVETLSAYLDRELGPAERDAVRAHLADCDRCRAEERDLRALKGLLLGVRAPEPAEDFEARLMSRLHQEAARPVRTPALPRFRPSTLAPWGGLAVAASLALVVASHSPRTTPTESAVVRPAEARVVQNVDFEVDAQHSMAYEQAVDPTEGAPILMPRPDGP